MALAIELAAPRLKMLKPHELAKRLDDRFRILTGGSRTALPRQQTLKALIDWSYNLLSEAEQTLAAAPVGLRGRLDAGRRCGRRRGRSAARRGKSSTSPPRWSTSRWSSPMRAAAIRATACSNSTRQYAAEKLVECGEGGWQRRLAEYLVAFYAKADGGVADYPYRRLARDLRARTGQSARAAVEWAFGSDGDVPLGLDLVGYSMRLLFELSLFPELSGGSMRRSRESGNGTPPATVARLWLAKNFYIDSLSHPVAAAAALQAVELYRGLSEPQALGVALMRAGAALVRPGNTAEGEALLREARALLEPLGPSKYLGECLDLTGTCHGVRGRSEWLGDSYCDRRRRYIGRSTTDPDCCMPSTISPRASTGAGHAERAVEIAREAVEIGMNNKRSSRQ